MSARARHLAPDTAQKIADVQAAITAAGDALRARHPVLRHQNALGAAILAFALAGMAGCAWAYAVGALPAFACIPLVAFFASLTHELEHDLIHRLYYRHTPWAHNLMLALVWLARPSTINPWVRRELHFNHHKHSGTAIDLEERAITNGEPWGPLRLWMSFDNAASLFVRVWRIKDAHSRRMRLARGLGAYFPLGWLHWGAWYAFLGFHAANAVAQLAGSPVAWAPATLAAMSRIDFLVVVLVAPNVLRTLCLHGVSSNMHYYGDIEDGNLLQQCQVFDRWWLAPLQLFCFNFGATHAIHHFVVRDPFYIRQAIAPAVRGALRTAGVRFNDFASLGRANRYYPSAPPALGKPEAAR